MSTPKPTEVTQALRLHNAAVLTWAATGPNEFFTGQEEGKPIDPTTNDLVECVDHLAHSDAMKLINERYPLIPVEFRPSPEQLLLLLAEAC
ncbi:MAG: hypothetical protein HYV68_00630 [Candidatus Taylorbacteria bacterium]|nr:hypothetical protein [Candidatus Taylorbacteria bacterium]